MPKITWGPWVKLVVCIFLPLAVGAIGGAATASSVGSWYQTLTKPVFTPPSWLFAPAWTALYVLMGVAAWLVWRRGWGAPAVRPALILFGIQLLLNAFWSPVFFGLRSPGAGLVVIVALLAALLATTIAFARVRGLAAVLLVPYILWVGFATVLNAAVWRLNP